MIVNAFESVGLMVELWESMSGAVNDPKDLRQRDHKVEDLRDEQQKHGL